MKTHNKPTLRVMLVEPLEDRQVMTANPAVDLSTQTFTLDAIELTRYAQFTSTAPNLTVGAQDAQASSLIRRTQMHSAFPTYRGGGYTVAVLDTGVDYNHTSLGGGWGNRVIGGYDFVNNDFDPMDDNGHGTHVAGVIGSSHATYAGLAPNVNIVALKVLDSNGSGNFANVEKALQWVINNRAAFNIVSINMSLGAGNFATNPYSFLEDEFSTLVNNKVFIAASAGNSFYSFGSTPGIGYPAISENVVSVGAVWDANVGGYSWGSGAIDYSTAADRITSFSQRGPGLKMLAPGALITNLGIGNSFVTMAGTSMASPMIAGAAVLIRQALDSTGRGALAYQNYILGVMQNTGVAVNDGDDENDNVNNTGLSFKRLDIFNAMSSLLNVANTAPTLGAIADQTITNQQTSLLLNLNGADAEGDTLTYTATFLPPRGMSRTPASFTINGNQLRITPDAGFAGEFWVRATVSDGRLTATREFKVTVEANSASLPFTDGFDRSAGDVLSRDWYTRQGGWSIVNGQARSNYTTEAAVSTTGTAVQNVGVAADVAISAQATTMRSAELLARYQLDGSTYMGRIIAYSNTSIKLEILRFVGGKWTTLATRTIAQTSGRLAFTVVDATLTLTLNETTITAHDTAIAGAGQVGIRGRLSVIDNFLAARITSSSTAAFTDSFTQTGGLGTGWTTRSGQFTVSSQQARNGTADTALATTSVNAANVKISADVNVSQGSGRRRAGFVARYQDNGDHYIGHLVNHHGTVYAEIWRMKGGVLTMLKQTQVSATSGRLEFEAIGTTLRLSLNGTVVVNTTDTGITNTGFIGIRSVDGTLANFRGEVTTTTLETGPSAAQANAADQYWSSPSALANLSLAAAASRR